MTGTDIKPVLAYVPICKHITSQRKYSTSVIINTHICLELYIGFLNKILKHPLSIYKHNPTYLCHKYFQVISGET